MEIKDLDFSYDERPLIRHLCGKILLGRVTSILGPNGSGKSTLLNLLVRQLRPKGGSILIEGTDLSSMSTRQIAKKIAMVHQQNTAPNDLSVERLVRFGRMPHQTMFSAHDEDAEEVVDWALGVTNLKEMADKRVGQLSGGERQRAWIAMALAQKTNTLFLDEPTTYLDIFYQLEVLSLIRRLNREFGMTIVMVLHDINHAIQFSDSLIMMHEGEIVYAGDVEEGITKERLQEVYGIRSVVCWSGENNCPYIIPIVEDATDDTKEPPGDNRCP